MKRKSEEANKAQKAKVEDDIKTALQIYSMQKLQVLRVSQFSLYFQCTFYILQLYAVIQCSCDGLQISTVFSAIK